MKELKKIDKFSLAKVLGLFSGMDGFFLTFIVVVLLIINIIQQKDFTGSVILVVLFNLVIGLFFAVLLSLIFAGIGWIMGLSTAVIYNIFAIRFGGIKIELVEVEDKKYIKEEQLIAEEEKELELSNSKF